MFCIFISITVQNRRMVTMDHLSYSKALVSGDKSNGHVTDNDNCLVIIIANDDSNIAAVQYLKLNI